MYRTLCILLFFLPGTFPAAAQSSDGYNAELIPPALRAYANAVIRNEEITVEVKDLNEVFTKYKKAVTVLNSNGRSAAAVVINYDKRNPVKELRASLYDAAGNLIRKFRSSDFEDISAVHDFSLFEDNRVKRLFPASNRYPYTVVFEYEQKTKHTFYFEPWMPQSAPEVSVEKSTYTFITPADFDIRFQELNLRSSSRREETVKDRHYYRWSAAALPALKQEPFSPPYENILTIVQSAPVRFSYAGMKGSFSNWQEYGKWTWEHLLKGRDELPEATRRKILELTKDTPGDLDKVRRIYEYAQRKNRYVSVQIGIGGLQPMRAEEVDRLGYGDCKGLVNYTMALLKAAGIRAIYTEVYAGETKHNIRSHFASVQGNHIILCVPLGKDTCWLECTDKNMPFGYLGSFTDDRDVLLCMEDGSRIVHTPAYPDTGNVQRRRASFTLNENGSLKGKITTVFGGLQYDNRGFLDYLSNKEQTDKLKEIYPLPDLAIDHYAIQREKKRRPAAREEMAVQSTHYATLNDHRLYLPLNMLNRLDAAPPEVRQRKNKVYIARGFHDCDTITYSLPAHFQLEWRPEEVHLENSFGRYDMTISVKDQKVSYTRNFFLRSGVREADDYDALARFLQQVAAYDKSKLIFKSTTNDNPSFTTHN